jgi:hypothetical protein
MTIKYPKLHNRAFNMVAMSLLAISCLNCGKGSGSGQNERNQENVESQKNDFSVQEFVDRIDKIIAQKEPLTSADVNKTEDKVDHKKAGLVMQVIQDMKSKFDKYLVAEKAKLNGSTTSIASKESHLYLLAMSIEVNVFTITSQFHYGKQTGDYEPFMQSIYYFRDSYEKIYSPSTKNSLDKIDQYTSQYNEIKAGKKRGMKINVPNVIDVDARHG